MVLAKEYRIPLPVSVDEYQIAQVYMVAKMSKEQTGHGEGVEIKENRPFGGAPELNGADTENLPYLHGNQKGQYTHKVYHIGQRLPSWIKAIAPTTALQIVEKAWNAYPYCKTIYSCPFLGDRFSITIVTRYLADNGNSENALQLTDQQLKELVVDTLDVAFDHIDPGKYKPEEDPTIFVSTKTGRGKLQKDWIQTTNPVMTCYKYCTVEFRYWGLSSRVENFIHKAGLRDVFLLGHRQAFCWIDEWFGLSMDEVRHFETKTQAELTTLLASDEEHVSVK